MHNPTIRFRKLIRHWQTLLLVSLLLTPLSARLTYTLSFDERAEHYVTVELDIDDVGRADFLDLKMPVWTPGSYLVRDFSRNVVAFEAFAGRTSLVVTKQDKQTWRIETAGKRRITVRYKVYAFEPTVRTSYVDSDMAMLNGASIFLYSPGMEQQENLVVISMPRTWQQATTSLTRVGGRSPVFRAAHYDELIDSPIMLGNHEIIDFEVAGVPHRYAISGSGGYSREQLVADTQTALKSIYDMFGSVPFSDYTIFLQLTNGSRGGLEHLKSTQLIWPRWWFDEDNYDNYLRLLTHEVFHAYNVKRIRPQALGPFDYSAENYTTMLWVAEGFTSYYGGLLPRRVGLLSGREYLDLLGENIAAVESTPGRLRQSLEEASYDAWIKYYKKNENSPNVTISYYSKGLELALMYDLAIRDATSGQKSLDDVFKILWQGYKDSGTGYTDEAFRAVGEAVAGRPLDDIYRYATTTDEIEWGPVFEPVGLTLLRYHSNLADSSSAWFGLKLGGSAETLNITGVVEGAPGGAAGLSARDELISVDGYRLTSANAAGILASRPLGKSAAFLVSRDGQIKSIKVRPVPKPTDAVKLEQVDNPTESQISLYEGWLNTTWD